ncbi:MAG: diguanylate cyclase domain-containing protein [Arenimonas sp.]
MHTITKNHKEAALLYLAQSNACRVIADWKCQTASAANAHGAAALARLPELQIRGLIAQSRGNIAMQEFTSGEEELGDAERLLTLNPNPELSADISLAYSSLSYSLGKNALAAEYAGKGLKELGDTASLPIRLRLMRNQARALSQLDKNSQAEKILRQAVELSRQLEDPKLSAELYVEIARIARTKGDISTQNESGQKILELGKRLSNSQVNGLGHEVLGLAALNNNDYSTAEIELRLAQQSFQELKLSRDERRVLRMLMRSMLGRNRPREEMERNDARLIELGLQLESDDRRLAADDFDSRLKYAQQKFDVHQLEATAALNAEREAAATARQRFTSIMAALSLILIIVLGIFSFSQRRFSLRLKEAFEKSRTAERALFLSESRMRSITDNIPALIAQFDKDQRYLFANDYISRIFGIKTSDMIGHTMQEIRGDKIYADLKPHVEEALKGSPVSFEGEGNVGGNQYYYQSNYVPDRDSDGNVQGFFALTFDITQLKTAEAKLEKLARIDSLTGVANRRHFEERLGAALAHSRRQQTAIALLYLDIDHFKSINDTHGHSVGDVVIQTFAKRLKACVREVDLVARLGGDEFVVLIENARADSGEIIAKKLLGVMKQAIIHEEHSLQITTSIGVAYCTRTSTAEALLNVADQALYAAKAAGRNTYQLKSDAS